MFLTNSDNFLTPATHSSSFAKEKGFVDFDNCTQQILNHQVLIEKGCLVTGFKLNITESFGFE